MKRLYLSLGALLFAGMASAQPPANYYQSAAGLSGTQLQTALYNKIKGHTVLSYTPGLWNAYKTTDKRPGTNYLWDIYSDIPGGTPPYQYTLGSGQCGSGANRENSCYNREHIWPQSKFSSNPPMVSDLWIVYPTDYYVNNQRSSMPYGKVGTASKTFMNGTKIGNNTYPGAPSGTCFEPIDSFKGDIARSYFYIATRYLGEGSSWSTWEMAVGSVIKPWAVQMLLEWNRLDPVSAKEVARNNAAFLLQKNRNPFIDSPQYAECIWGNSGNCRAAQSVATVSNPEEALQVFYDLNAGKIYLTADKPATAQLLDMQGRVLETLLPLTPESNRWELSINAWPRGMYLVRTQSQAGATLRRVVFP